MADQFAGFIKPKQNWSKLPHILIDALPLIETTGELKCILYLLRHSWGFSEFGKPKRFTIDEFMRGRKRRDSTRMDGGTGLSKPTVIDGLVRAEKHGFITVEVDERDRGRVKKLYTLRMERSRNFTPPVKKLYTPSQETLHPTEKETLERNHREKPLSVQTSSLGESPQPEPPPQEPTPPKQQAPPPVGLSEPQPAPEPAPSGDQPSDGAITEPTTPGDDPSAQPTSPGGLFDNGAGIDAPVGEPENGTASGDAPVAGDLETIAYSALDGILGDNPDPPRDYLTDLFAYANRDKPGDDDTHVRPKHWETVSDGEFAVCQHVAQLWCGGRLPFPGSIEAHCGAAGWLLRELNGGNLGACIRALDEYHRHYEEERMTFTVAGPKSLVAVLPAFLAQEGSGGEAGVIRLGG